MIVPLAAPGSPTRRDALRLLQMATFGARPGDVDHVLALGFDGWIDEQLAMPAGEGHVDRALRIRQTTWAGFERSVWEAYLSHPDQLRKRVAYALSQLFVVSRNEVDEAEAAAFADVLEAHCFGDFRTLLEHVTRSRAMGEYLTYERNRKADERRGRVPDENYAREVMQLFTIGLWELNPDGTRRLDGAGDPIPTYDNTDIVGLARVFTGFRSPEVSHEDPPSLSLPMMSTGEFAERYHERGEKRFLGHVIPADENRTLDESLAQALDVLAAHANVAPFVSHQLIQRLVTSNPSAAYVGRVADVFRATGGDLAAVVRAVLLDDAAWPATPDPTFGKLREPVLRFTTILRAVGAELEPGAARWPFTSLDDAATSLGQQPFRSPSVFNFYRPGYVPPQTPLGEAGLVGPEFQIANETTAIGWVNFVAHVLRKPPTTRHGPEDDPVRLGVVYDLDPLIAYVATSTPSAADVDALVDDLADRLCPRGVSASLRSLIAAHVPNIRHRDYDRDQDDERRQRGRERTHLDRVVTAIVMIAVSTDFLHER